ncbi:MAG: plasmid pRiA4b ORF-3 family protein [bacterium]
MPSGKKASSNDVYQLKLTLKYIKPPIWRRLQVRGDTNLGDLHYIIQSAMGWDNSHLHEFKFGKESYADPEFELDGPFGGRGVKDENRTILNAVARRKGAKFLYEYDFGDGWEHEILVEKILAPEAGVRYPRCVKGARACPPEDCGGPWGYPNILHALANPKDPESAELLEWLGPHFDPEAFDLKRINRKLK